jgi:hypothetical protein
VAENDDILRRLERLEKEARTPAWGRTASAGQKYFVLPRPRRVTLPDPQEDVGAGAGIDVTENKVSVDLATDPGLEFDAAGDEGQLRVKPDGARGLSRNADGVGLNPAGGAKYDVWYVNAAVGITRGPLKLRA